MKKIYILIQVLFLSFAVNSQNALDFDGIDDYIGPAGLINSTNSITVEAWINTTNIASQTFPPILYISQMCSLELSGNNIAFWVIGTSGNFSSTQYTINDGQWYHVAGTYDGTTIQLYINGVQQSSVSTGGTNFLSTGSKANLGYIPLVIVSERNKGEKDYDAGDESTWTQDISMWQTTSTTITPITITTTAPVNGLNGSSQLAGSDPNLGRDYDGVGSASEDARDVSFFVLRMPCAYGYMTSSYFG